MDDAAASRVLRPRHAHNNTQQEEKLDKPNYLSKKERRNASAREWYARLKEDKEKYAAFRAIENVRSRVYRFNLSEEKKAKQRENSRIRQQKYRERKRINGEISQKNQIKKTRAGIENQRKIWRDAKRIQRAKMSVQKKRRINEKRRKKYSEKKNLKERTSDVSHANINSKHEGQENVESTAGTSYNTNAAKRKAISRCLRVFPKNPQKFAEVYTIIESRCSPQKKAAIKHKRGIETTAVIRDKIKELRLRRNEKDNKIRRALHAALAIKGKISKLVQRNLNLSKKLCKMSKDELEDTKRKRRSDAIAPEEVKRVTDFYQSSENSRELPIQRLVNAKTKEAKKVLEASLEQSYQAYRDKNGDSKISFSKFVQLRPANVLPSTKQKHFTCLCEYCVNIDFMVKAISRYTALKGILNPAKDRYDISRSTLCEKVNGHYQKQCIDRNCDNCGVQLIDQKLENLNEFLGCNISWKKWEQVEDQNKQKKFMSLVVKNGSVQQLIRELKNSLEPFSKHLFNAKWQAERFEEMKTTLPENWVLFCLDFGENYTCHQQDEAQGAHWHYTQVTLHPIVVYYHCQFEECDEVVHESLVFVSNDHKHDYYAVQHFINLANDYLLGKGLQILKEIQFSDGAPTQYKSKANFVDLSLSENDSGINTEKHFFGSRHGKGPCDGEVGVVKRSAALASKKGQVITNAEEFYKYAKEQLSRPKTRNGESLHVHSMRTFFYVPEGTILRDQQRFKDTKAIQQTRLTHQFRAIQPYIVTARERSCFCEPCIKQEGNCQNEAIVGKWKVFNLKIKRKTVAVVNEGPVQVDGPAEDLAEVNVGNDGPAEVNLVNGPAEVNLVNDPAEVNLVNGPAEVNLVNDPAEVNLVNGPAEVNLVNGPAEVNLVNDPAEVNLVNGPAEVNLVNGPVNTTDDAVVDESAVVPKPNDQELVTIELDKSFDNIPVGVDISFDDNENEIPFIDMENIMNILDQNNTQQKKWLTGPGLCITNTKKEKCGLRRRRDIPLLIQTLFVNYKHQIWSNKDETSSIVSLILISRMVQKNPESRRLEGRVIV